MKRTLALATMLGAWACTDARAGESFMGRTIARTMSHHGASWLVRPERQAEEGTALLLEQLGLSPGQVACDLGAGIGYYTLRMAQKVGPSGRAVAVDIQPEMLEMLQSRAEKAGVKNVETILGTQDDPKLGRARCDLILLVDVYHELSDPPAMLAAMKAALRPGGHIALVEYRAEDPSVPIKPLHKMSKAQMLAEFGSAGLAPIRSFDGLPWQHLVFFGAEETSPPKTKD
ncbi:MAG: methyltransferase domain-containing protein [Myxococcota bacterium]